MWQAFGVQITNYYCFFLCGVFDKLLMCFIFLLFQMAAFNIQEALTWKEKIEFVIDQVISVRNIYFVLF